MLAGMLIGAQEIRHGYWHYILAPKNGFQQADVTWWEELVPLPPKLSNAQVRTNL